MKFNIKNKTKDKLFFIIATEEKILYAEEITSKENEKLEEIEIEFSDI